MPDIILPGFPNGVTRVSPQIELDHGEQSLAKGVNIEIDLLGNIYTMNGYRDLTTGAGYQAVKGFHYCEVLNRIIVAVGGGLKIHTIDGALDETHLGVLDATNRPTFVSWPPTGVCYVSDLTSFIRINADLTITDLTATVPRGPGLLFKFKGSLLSARNPVDGPCGVSISRDLDPENHNSTDVIKIPHDGNEITGISGVGGTANIHKLRGITNIGGNILAGVGKDVWKLPLENGVGMVHHNAAAVANKLLYFMGFNGMHVFNGQESQPQGQKIYQLITNAFVRSEGE